MTMTAGQMHTCTKCSRHDWQNGCAVTACALWTWRTSHTPLETPERGRRTQERENMTQHKGHTQKTRKAHLLVCRQTKRARRGQNQTKGAKA